MKNIAQKITALSLPLILPLSAFGQTWTNPGTGDWFTPSNWTVGVPSSGTNATFTNGGTATIASPGAAANVARIGTYGSVQSGSVTLSAGGTLSTYETFIGNGDGASGQVALSGAGTSWTNSYQLFVGYDDGSGSISIEGGAVVTSQFSEIANGEDLLSASSVSVSGAGSRFDNTAFLKVGNQGTGTLSVTGGAKVTSIFGAIAMLPHSVGSVTVSGAGSEWASSATLYVGHSGAATLVVEDGGLVSAGSVSAAQLSLTSAGAPSSASIAVRGEGSRLSAGSGMAIGGNGGTATVTVSGGGTVSANGGAGTISLLDGSSLTIGGGGAAGTVSASAVRTGTSTGAKTGSVVFDHADSDYSFTPQINGGISVSHEGTGTTVLTAASSYTGATSVTGGTLVINGSMGSSAVSVSGDGTLRGGGIVNGAITLDAGGTIAAGGGSDEVLDAASLTWNGGGRLAFELGESTGRLALGTMSKGTGGIYEFHLAEGDGFGIGVYGLASYLSTDFVISDFTVSGLGEGVEGNLFASGNVLSFEVTAIPEPSTYSMLLVVAAFGLGMGRKLRKR